MRYALTLADKLVDYYGGYLEDAREYNDLYEELLCDLEDGTVEISFDRVTCEEKYLMGGHPSTLSNPYFDVDSFI